MAIRGDIEEVKGNDTIVNVDPALAKKLAEFQDMKLGVIIHWGLYAEAGIVESWQLSAEDEWARKKPWREDLETLRTDYWNLNRSFNPTQFDPEDWAEKCREAGFKYLLFTTKHHDGFNLYDTKLSDYKITDQTSPFHKHPKSNLLKEVFEAFRKEELTVGAYYSKADWHSPYYWVPGETQAGRYPSYVPAENPEMWEQFVQFVHGQLAEIMTDYGEIDILWLDAGWVSPQTGEDLRMAEIAANLREKQPNLIIVDRTVGGEFENYVTPERSVPVIPPQQVWESNIPLAKNWGYVPNDTYKSLKEILHTLVQVVAKGGNLILGVGPKPDGTLPVEAEEIMTGMGQWLAKAGAGIYGTQPVKTIYNETDRWYLTEKGNERFAFFLITEKDQSPQELVLSDLGLTDEEVREMTALATGDSLKKIKEGHWALPKTDEQDVYSIKIELERG